MRSIHARWSVRSLVTRLTSRVFSPVKREVGRGLQWKRLFLRYRSLRRRHQYIRQVAEGGILEEILYNTLVAQLMKLCEQSLGLGEGSVGGDFESFGFAFMRHNTIYFLLKQQIHSDIPKGKVVVRGQEGSWLLTSTNMTSFSNSISASCCLEKQSAG
jgi:hypothetical protein